eukprot:7530466-Alexandrium_andersonii.AAC.1
MDGALAGRQPEEAPLVPRTSSVEPVVQLAVVTDGVARGPYRAGGGKPNKHARKRYKWASKGKGGKGGGDSWRHEQRRGGDSRRRSEEPRQRGGGRRPSTPPAGAIAGAAPRGRERDRRSAEDDSRDRTYTGDRERA